MKPPLVSVIIPVYNGERYISEAIKSAISQTYPSIEIFVVNDGSQDNTEEKIQPYINRIIYIYQNNRGTATARNNAIKNSSGEYVAFLDHDDIWVPEKMGIQIEYLQKNPEFGMVHSNYCFVDANDKPLKRNDKPMKLEGKCFKELFIQNNIAISTAVIRKACFDRIGLFDENLKYVEDRDLWLRLSREFSIGYIDQILCYYRLHDSNMTRNKIEHLRYRYKCFKKTLKQYPDTWTDVGRPAVKKCLFKNLYNLAVFCSNAGKYHKAIFYYIKAMLLDPFEFFVIQFSPARANLMRWYKFRLDETLRNFTKRL